VLKGDLEDCVLANLALPRGVWHLVRPEAQGAMSWSELERLVDQSEVDAALRRSLKGCRSTPELILAARRLGYQITRIDLRRAWEEERQEYKRQAQG
jgi:hypothetical protein